MKNTSNLFLLTESRFSNSRNSFKAGNTAGSLKGIGVSGRLNNSFLAGANLGFWKSNRVVGIRVYALDCDKAMLRRKCCNFGGVT